jgi:hypothetical protein
MRHDSEQKVCAVGFVVVVSSIESTQDDTFAFILRNSEIRTGHFSLPLSFFSPLSFIFKKLSRYGGRNTATPKMHE